MSAKKSLTVILALLLIFSTAACSKSTSSGSGTTGSGQSDKTALPEFTETVIVDDENCTFTITAIEENNGYTWDVYLENKTDKNLMFSLDMVSLNGFMCDPYWATTVTAGMKSNDEINWYSSTLSESGVADTVTAAEFELRIYDSDDWSADSLVDAVYTVYPHGEAAVQTYTREAQADDNVLFDNEYATMVIVGVEPDSTWGYTLNVYLENKTDNAQMFSADDVSVNGFMCDPYWATSVAAGKKKYCTISWSDSKFEESNITEVETITMPVKVYNYDDWTVDDYIDETFTLNMK